MVAGASEAAIVPLCVAGFNNMTALSRNEDPATASRPFDLNRDGFVPGEGAGILVLEELGSCFGTRGEDLCRADGLRAYVRCLPYHCADGDRGRRGQGG